MHNTRLGHSQEKRPDHHDVEPLVNDFIDDETILDRVTKALVERPRTFSELFGMCALRTEEPLPNLDQIEEALDILSAAGAIKEFKETKYGERMRIFGLKSESRTYVECSFCEGSGFMPSAKRGLCPICHGNGLVTPTADE